MTSITEQEREDVEVSVVNNCAVIAGTGVTAVLEEELETWLSEKQLDVVLASIGDVV